MFCRALEKDKQVDSSYAHPTLFWLRVGSYKVSYVLSNALFGIRQSSIGPFRQQTIINMRRQIRQQKKLKAIPICKHYIFSSERFVSRIKHTRADGDAQSAEAATHLPSSTCFVLFVFVCRPLTTNGESAEQLGETQSVCPWNFA